MLTAEGCRARRKRLWESLPTPCDALVVADPQHLVYFANFFVTPFTFRAAEAGAILILEPDRATLVADNLLEPAWAAAHVDEVVAPAWYEGKSSAGNRRVHLANAAGEVLSRLHPARVGVELASVPASLLRGRPESAVVDLDPIIRPMRRSKDADELVVLGRSMRAGDAALAAVLANLQPGMTELDAYLIAQRAAIESAGHPVVVYGDFVSGSRTGEIGGPPTDRVIKSGDLFLVDLSVIVHGYRGDFANTFVVGAGPTQKQRDDLAHCLAAIEVGEGLLMPGAECREIDLAVRQAIPVSPGRLVCPGHTGHGLGLGHPEPPYLVPLSMESLVLGDVVTLEPGVYVPGESGMRFERNYLITSSGFEVLTHHRLTLDQGESGVSS
ncbi:M24 family metallopeptidase [Isosphaeraceae bacterium EP7]